MRKLYTTIKYKKWNKLLANYSFINKVNFKKQKTIRNRYINERKKDPNKYLKDKKLRKSANYNFIHAPETFSFIENPIEVVKFISELSENYESKHEVYIDLKNVKAITYDAIVILLSIMVKFKSQKILFNGNFPDNTSARSIIDESKFLIYLYKSFNDKDRYLLSESNSIYTHAFKSVDSALSSQIIENASKTIWGNERRCQGVQRTLIELMLNTNNHADINKKGEKHWWLSVHHDKINCKVSFAFVDFGVGIFSSLNSKQNGSLYYGILEKIKSIYSTTNNAQVLKLILEGELHRTATGKYYHGKGLYGINNARKRNQISNLNIITNDVYANVDKDQYETLTKSFNGTFVYWEVSINNDNIDE